MADRIVTTKRRMLWVYGLDLPRDAANDLIAEPVEKWDENDELVRWPLAVALASGYLDHDEVEPAFVDNLGKPLSAYLQAATRADPTLFEVDKDRLDGAKGMIIMITQDPDDTILSRTPPAPYTFLGVYPQEPYSFSLGAMPEKTESISEPMSKPRFETPSVSQEPKNMTLRNILTAAVVLGIVGAIMIVVQLVR